MFGIDDLVLGGLAFGGKLLGGLGAASSAKSARKTAMAVAGAQQSTADQFYTAESNYVNAWNPVADAQRFGFNPVTWLNSGSAAIQLNAGLAAMESKKAGYMSSYDTVSNMPNKVSALSTIGGAITAGVDAYQTAAETSAKEAATSAAQENMAKYLQTVQRARAGGNPMAGLGTPHFSTAGSRLTGGGAAAALSLGSEVPGLVNYKNNVTAIGSLHPNSSFSDAIDTERRYGGFMSSVYGIGVAGVDAWNTYFGPKRAADPGKDYGFGTRFNPNAANDRVPLGTAWWPTGSLSPYKVPTEQMFAPGAGYYD